MRTGVYKCTWNGTDYPSEGESPAFAVRSLAMNLCFSGIASCGDLDGTEIACDGRVWLVTGADTTGQVATRRPRMYIYENESLWSAEFVEVESHERLSG